MYFYKEDIFKDWTENTLTVRAVMLESKRVVNLNLPLTIVPIFLNFPKTQFSQI